MNIMPEYNLKNFELLRTQAGFRIYKLIKKLNGQPGYVVIPPWGGIEKFKNFRKAVRNMESEIKRTAEVFSD